MMILWKTTVLHSLWSKLILPAGDIHLILEERAGLVEVLGGTKDMPTEKD